MTWNITKPAARPASWALAICTPRACFTSSIEAVLRSIGILRTSQEPSRLKMITSSGKPNVMASVSPR